MAVVLAGVMAGTGRCSPAPRVHLNDYTFPNTRAHIQHTHTHTQAQHRARNAQLLQEMDDSLEYTDDPLLFREFDDTPTRNR